MKKINYPFIIRPLTKEEGKGYLIEYPDLPGCISDGDSIDEAIKNGQDAVMCWIKAAKDSGRNIPKPSSKSPSGRWLQRAPKSLHAKLIAEAKKDGVSLNTLVVSIIAANLGSQNKHIQGKHKRH